jgi:hypothetical protein
MDGRWCEGIGWELLGTEGEFGSMGFCLGLGWSWVYIVVRKGKCWSA